MLHLIFVNTSSDTGAGTSSSVGLTVADEKGNKVVIPDLVAWGGRIMPPDHIFFQSGNFDQFMRCLESEPCYLKLTTSGAGDRPDWRCDRVRFMSLLSWGHTFYVLELLNKVDFTAARAV